jgi:putative transposase
MENERQKDLPRRRCFTEEIIGKSRGAEVLLSQGQPVGQVSRSLGTSDQRYYRWRKEYGGPRTEHA